MYDTIIIGGGAAGLTAAIYCSRYLLKNIVLSKNYGGQLLETYDIENYPGTPHITGMELSNNFKDHAKKLGTETHNASVHNIKKENNTFTVETDIGEFKSKTIILALGSKRRELNVKGEQEFKGKGVSYCATCDAPFFADKNVAVVGSGNSAAESALLLEKYAKDIKILIRKEKMKCDQVSLKKINDSEKISIINKVNVKEIKGKDTVTSVLLDNKEELKLDGIYIEIGYLPDTSLIKDMEVELEEGFIKVNNKQETNICGLFAAGDITTASNKFAQITIACAEATIAAHSTNRYLQELDCGEEK